MQLPSRGTLRKKLKEYVALGLIVAEKKGRQFVYRLPETSVNLAAWRDAIAFFSEDNPLGVIGSYLLDKYDDALDFLSFKHRYLLFALDSGIILDLLTAIQKIELELVGGRNGQTKRCITLPLKIYISVQGGRQYLSAYNPAGKKICFFRLDSIQKVKPLEVVESYETYQECLRGEQPETTWWFSADVYDALELLPWLRTFIGRIASLNCSNKRVEEQFWGDISALVSQYGEDEASV